MYIFRIGMDDDGKARKNGLLLTNDGRGVGTGQAAGVMGYTDAKKGFNIANVIAKNSVTYSLEQLKKLKVKGMASGADPTLDSYAEYGLSLKNAGLDKTSSTFSFGSGMLDKVVYFFYWFANATPYMMKTVVKVLQLLNPFAFVSKFMTSDLEEDAGYESFASNTDKDKDGNKTDFGTFWDKIYPMLTVFGNYVSMLKDFSLMVLLPLFIGFAIVAILLLKMSFKSTFGRMIIRLFIMILGVPLIGSVYTQTLNTIATSSDEQSAYFTRIVYTNYLDFRSWAFNTRLGIPSELEGVIKKDGSIQGKSLDEVTLTLNAYALNDRTLLSLEDAGNPFADMADTSTAVETKKAKKNAYAANVNALLSTVSSSNMYRLRSSDYEGLVKAEAQKLIGTNESDQDNNKAIRNIFNLSEDVLNDDDKSKGLLSASRSAAAKEALTEKTSLSAPPYKYDIYNAGALKRESGLYRNGKGAALSALTKRGSTTIPSFSKGDDAYIGSGLSPLGMYNYLNTSFAPSSTTDTGFEGGSLSIYSPAQSNNDMLQQYHHSVLMTGSGLAVPMKYVLICVTFIVLAALQLSVVFSIFRLAVSKFTSMAGGIVGTMMGSLTSFIKMASAALVTIGVVVASMALYNLYAGILVGMFQWVNDVVNKYALSEDLVGYAVKLIFVGLFGYFGFKSISQVGRHLGAIVDEIVQKFSNALQQNWARQASLGSMGNPYGTMGMAGGMAGGMGGAGGVGRSGKSGKNGKEPYGDWRDGAKSVADLMGAGKQVGGAMDLWETGDRALDDKNKERQARGEAPLKTEGIGGMLNRAKATGEYYKKGREAKKRLKSEGKLGKGADARTSKLAQMTRVDDSEQSKARMEATGRARQAYANDEKAQNSGAAKGAYVDEQVTRSLPGFDKSTVGEDGLRAETYTDSNGNESIRLVDQYGRTSEEAGMVADLVKAEDKLQALRNTDTSNMDADQKKAHNKEIRSVKRQANQTRKNLSNVQTSTGEAKYGKEQLSGAGLKVLNHKMQSTFGQRSGEKGLNLGKTGKSKGVHDRKAEAQVRRSNPNTVRNDGLRVGGSEDLVKAKSQAGVGRMVENLYDSNGHSLGDLVAMNNLQHAYDMVSYGQELKDKGFNFAKSLSIANDIAKAQQSIGEYQNTLISSGYQASQISQASISATMGGLERTLGRTQEYSEHKQANNKHIGDIVQKTREMSNSSKENSGVSNQNSSTSSQFAKEPSIAKEITKAQQSIGKYQDVLTSSGYQASQISQGRSQEYSEHKQANNKHIADIVRNTSKTFDGSKENSGVSNQNHSNSPQRTIVVNTNPRKHGRSGGRGYGPRGRNKGRRY